MNLGFPTYFIADSLGRIKRIRKFSIVIWLTFSPNPRCDRDISFFSFRFGHMSAEFPAITPKSCGALQSPIISFRRLISSTRFASRSDARNGANNNNNLIAMSVAQTSRIVARRDLLARFRPDDEWERTARTDSLPLGDHGERIVRGQGQLLDRRWKVFSLGAAERRPLRNKYQFHR